MNLPTEIFGNVVVVHAPEELGQDQAGPFREFVRGLERNRAVLDLDATESLTSAGLTAVLDVLDDLREQGGDLKIATANPVNRKILEITHLDEQLEIFEGVIDAVRSFR